MKTNLSFLNKFEEDAYQKLISGLNEVSAFRSEKRTLRGTMALRSKKFKSICVEQLAYLFSERRVIQSLNEW